MKKTFHAVLFSGLAFTMLTYFSCSHPVKNKELFFDPLNGTVVRGWKVAPINFVDHPKYGKVLCIESEKSGFIENAPWVGDSTWEKYRVEVELTADQLHFVGIDYHVQEDGKSGNNFQFYTYDTVYSEVVESCGFWGGYEGAWSWKLWPVSQKKIMHGKDKWFHIRMDVMDRFVNVYVDNTLEPVFTIYDIPYSKGGVRLWSFSKGKAYLRNFRVTSLENENIRPILADDWKNVRKKNILFNWQVTPPQSPEFGKDSIPPVIHSSNMKWIEAETDGRGVINLGAMFPNQNTQGTVFAKTVIHSEQDKLWKAWVTYTDRCMIYCNKNLVFKGPNRGWNDPESHYDCRIRPDHFEIELPLKKGENEILLRSQVTENWGWGFWMRLE